MAIKKPEKWKPWLHDNGRLRKNLPSTLLPEIKTKDDDEVLQEFLLTLSLIFNDIKGLLMTHDTMAELYDYNQTTETTAHRGEYAGIKLQLQKLLFGTLHETFEYLEKSQEVYTSKFIQKLIKSTSNKTQTVWGVLNRFAVGAPVTDTRFSDLNDLLPILEKIRHNISFHYQTRKQLRGGYRSFFYRGISIATPEDRKWAYRSSERGHFDLSRYYYADAAVQGYLNTIFGGDEKYREAEGKVITLLGMILNALNELLIKYHEGLPQK